MTPEKTNKRENSPLENEKDHREKDECGDESSWSGDQKKRGYYYDDETNYQVYRPEDDEEEDNFDDKD